MPWKPEFQSYLVQNLMQSIPHPNDASDKIWLRLAHWLRRYSSLKMFTDALTIHVISPYFGGSSLYFVYFPENLPTKIFRISHISYTSPYLEFQISLPNFKNFLLCLIILPIWKTKSPYLSSGMYHMYGTNAHTDAGSTGIL